MAVQVHSVDCSTSISRSHDVRSISDTHTTTRTNPDKIHNSYTKITVRTYETSRLGRNHRLVYRVVKLREASFTITVCAGDIHVSQD